MKWLSSFTNFNRYRLDLETEGTPAYTHFQDLTMEAYEYAFNLSLQLFGPCHPHRLGITLSLTCFMADTGSRGEAVKIAEEQFKLALDLLDNVPEEVYRDATSIMQLLRDNFVFWSADFGG